MESLSIVYGVERVKRKYRYSSLNQGDRSNLQVTAMYFSSISVVDKFYYGYLLGYTMRELVLVLLFPFY